LSQQPFWVKPVREVDGKVGFYGGVDYTFARKYKAGVFYYDNRGDPEEIRAKQYGWDTRFWSFNSELELPADVKLIGQYMTGNTLMGFQYGSDNRRSVDVDFEALYVLLSKKIKRLRVTARYDWFETTDNSFIYADNNNEWGDAYLASASWEFSKKISVVAEFLHIDSWRPARQVIGFASDQKNDILQLSLRQRF
jgi:hypothetical protein